MLYLFDLDGTLITSYMDAADRNYHVWEVLPGRRERIEALVTAGNWVGIITNQAGVAHGHIAERDVRTKLHQVAAALALDGADAFDGVTIHDGGVAHMTGSGELPVWVCYDDTRGRDLRYRLDLGRRKPSGAMIREAMSEWAQQAAQGVLYVGDREEDLAAAKDAGVPFQWAHIFFKDQP